MSQAKAADDRKRSVTIAGHRTSVSLEPEFWEALGEIAAQRRMSVAALIAVVDADRGARGLSAAIRVHVLDYYRSARSPGSD